MNYEITNTENNFETGIVGNISTGSIENKEKLFSDKSFEDYENYGETILTEISRIKNISRDDARSFVDFSSFDEILLCLRNGLSDLGELDHGILAMAFCHISTS